MDHRNLHLPHWREHWDALRPSPPREPAPGPVDGPMLFVLLLGAAVAAGLVVELVRG